MPGGSPATLCPGVRSSAQGCAKAGCPGENRTPASLYEQTLNKERRLAIPTDLFGEIGETPFFI